MITGPRIIFGSNGLTIKENIASVTVVFGGSQSFVDITDLETEIKQNKYATFEPDMWVLDGNYKLIDASPHVGYMSTTMSGSNSNFSPTTPRLSFAFSSVYSTSGLTLFFSNTGDWADSVTVEFFNSLGVSIRSDTYTPTGESFSTGQAVANFKYINITFNSTNKPYRFARLTGIDFDEITRFDETNIKTAKLIEAIDPLSLELPINTLDFTLYSADGDFSIVDPQGVYATLSENEPIDLFQRVGNTLHYYGRFYLDEWKSQSDKLANFRAIDAIGVLDKTPISIDVITRLFVGSSVAQTMDLMGFPYEVDAGVYSLAPHGWLSDGSMRDALRQLLFSFGAFANCARSNKIMVYPIELASDLTAYDYTLTDSEKGIESPVELKPLVTGVELKKNYYVYDGVGESNYYQGSFIVGTHILAMDKPLYSFVSISGGTYIGGMAGYIEFSVASPGTVSINYLTYRKNVGANAASVYNLTLPAGTPSNIIKIDNAMLSHTDYEQTAAQRVYDYFLQRYIQKTRLFASLIAVGDSVLIDTQSSKQIKGIVEKMTTDLTGGMVADIEIVGVIA